PARPEGPPAGVRRHSLPLPAPRRSGGLRRPPRSGRRGCGHRRGPGPGGARDRARAAAPRLRGPLRPRPGRGVRRAHLPPGDRRRSPACPPHRRTARPGRPDPRAQPESTKGTRMTTSGVLQVAVERVAADAPATVGWIDGTATRTYGELDATADHLADRLRRRGIGTGDIVALLLARGPDMLLAMLGVLKTGAAY